jgi:hypothetical protein
MLIQDHNSNTNIYTITNTTTNGGVGKDPESAML